MSNNMKDEAMKRIAGDGAQQALESLCQWLLHRFGPDSPEGNEASSRLAAPAPASPAALTDEPLKFTRYEAMEEAARKSSEEMRRLEKYLDDTSGKGQSNG